MCREEAGLWPVAARGSHGGSRQDTDWHRVLRSCLPPTSQVGRLVPEAVELWAESGGLEPGGGEGWWAGSEAALDMHSPAWHCFVTPQSPLRM